MRTIGGTTVLSATLLVATVLSTTVPAPAFAKAIKPKAAVLEVRGWKGAHVRDLLTGVASRSVTLVPKQELVLASRMVNLESPLGVTKLLAAVGAGLALQGSVADQGAAASTLVQVFARDGRRLAKWAGPGPGSKSGDAAIAKGAQAALGEALRKIDLDPTLVADAARPEEKRVDRRRADDEPRAEAAKTAKGSERQMPSLADAWSDPAPKIGWVDHGKAASADAGSTVLAHASEPARSEPGRSNDPAELGAPARPTPKDEEPALPSRPIPKDELDEPVVQNAVFIDRKAPKASFASATSGSPAIAGNGSDRGGSSSSFASERRPVGRAVIVPKDELVIGPSEARTVSALAGVTLRRRLAEVSLDDGRTAKHDTGMFPEITIFARTRPFSGSGSALGGVFADLEGAFAVGLSSAIEADKLSTSALRLSFTAGWQWESDWLSLGPTVGFGLESVTLPENPILGSSSYTYVRPGLLAKALIAGEAFTAELGGGYRAVVSAGDVGAPYGQVATAAGFDVGARIGGTYDAISWGLGLSYERYSLAFGDPKDSTATVAAHSGSDGSLLATFVLGVALR